MAKKLTPTSIESLTDTLSSLPGIGPKSAFKLAVYLATNGSAINSALRSQLDNVAEKVGPCVKCNNLADKDSEYVCKICGNEERTESQLMIVETVADLIQIENSQVFSGYYFVTEKLISPLAGVTPQDIQLNKLRKLFTLRKIDEIIFAFASSVEAESTIMYIKDSIKDKTVSTSRLGRGLPAVGSIEYLDSQTIKGAVSTRENIS